MNIKPSLFGIKNSNRDFSKKEAWGKNQFNSSFPIALVAYMERKNLKCVYIKTNSSNEIYHTQISQKELFGLSALDDNIFYAFESIYTPFQKFYKGYIPRIDLVTQDFSTNDCLKGLEIKLTALPDNSTCELMEDKYSCEIVVRPDTISYLACTIAEYFFAGERRKRLKEFFCDIEHFDWTNEKLILNNYQKLLSIIDKISKVCCGIQTPLIVQPIWKTKGKSSILSDNCLDVFVWSNLSLIHLFVTNTEYLPTHIGRKERTLIWLIKMLYDFSSFGYFNASEIIDMFSFNTKNDKAFSVSGSVTYQFLKSIELLTPRITKNEIKNIICGGGQNLLSPERRFDAIIYNSPNLFEQ